MKTKCIDSTFFKFLLVLCLSFGAITSLWAQAPVLEEEFETWAPANFTVSAAVASGTGGTAVAMNSTPAAAAGHGTKYAHFQMMMVAPNPLVSAATLTSPSVDLSGLSNPTLSFVGWFMDKSMASPSTASMFVKIEESADGTTYTKVGDSIVSADASAWTEYKFALKGASKYVRVGVYSNTSGLNAFLLDGFKIGEGKSAPLESLTEGFEGTPCIPVGWTSVADASDSKVAWGCSDGKNGTMAPGNVKEGKQCVSFAAANGNEAAFLITPELKLAQGAKLEFAYFRGDFANGTDLEVSYSQDGNTYENLTFESKKASAWTQVSLDLDAQTKYVRFKGTHTAGQAPMYVYLDEVKISVTKEEPLTDMTEGFETACPPQGWDATATVGATPWSKTSKAEMGYPGPAEGLSYAAMEVSNGSAATSSLTTPSLVLGSKAFVEFKYQLIASSYAELEVLTSTDGVSYTQKAAYTSTTTEWTSVKIALTSDIKYIRFTGKYTSGRPVGPCLDMVKIYTQKVEPVVTQINENFEEGLPSSWTLSKIGNGDLKIHDVRTAREAPSSMPEGGQNCGIHYNSSWATSSDNVVFSTPEMDLSTCTTPVLSFWYWNKDVPSAQAYPYVRVSVSKNGTDWTLLKTGENTYTIKALTSGVWQQYATKIPKDTKFAKFEMLNTGSKNASPSSNTVFDLFYIGEKTCMAPVSIAIKDIAKSEATLTIDAFDDETSYKVAYGELSFFEDADYKAVPRTVGSNQTVYKLPSLKAETQYYVSVRTDCASSSVSVERKTNFTTLSACPKPSNLAVKDVTATGFKLSWKENGTAAAWIVACDQKSGASNFDWNTATKVSANKSTDFEIKSLTPEKTYALNVKAVCGVDTSAMVDLAIATTLPASCPLPKNMKLSDTTPSGFTIAWTAGGSETAWQVLIYSADKTSSQGVSPIDVTTPTYTATTLKSGSAYMIEIRAYCSESDQSKWTTPLRAQTECINITEESLPYEDGFEQAYTTGNLLSPCMSSTSAGYGEAFRSQNAPSMGASAHSGTNYMQVWSTKMGGNNKPTNERMFLPKIDLIGGHKYELSYYACVSAQYRTAEQIKGIFMLMSTVGVDTAAATQGMIGSPKMFALKDTNYAEYKVVYTPLASGSYYFGLHAQATAVSTDEILAIDDFKIRLITDCKSVENAHVKNIKAKQAQIVWDTTQAAAYQICYGESENFTKSNQSVYAVKGDSTYVLGELKPSTEYSFQIRGICAEKDTSAWTSLVTFTTALACPAPKAVQIEAASTVGFTLKVTPGQDETRWIYTCKEGVSYELGSTQGDTLFETQKVIESLQHSRYYSVAVRALCGEDGSSTWVKTLAKTSCAAFELPYTQGFEQALESELLPCMASEGSPLVSIRNTELVGSVTAHSGVGFAYAVNANSTLWMPNIKMQAGETAEISVWFQGMDVGTLASASLGYKKEGKFEMLVKDTVSAAGVYKLLSTRFKATEAGEYTLGIYLRSPERAIAIDDFSVTRHCEEPTHLYVSRIESSSARLAWKYKADSCLVEYRKQGQNGYTSVYSKDSICTLSSLESGSVYEWRIKAMASYGQSDYVNGPNFTTKEITCPEPSQLTATEITDSKVKLNWTGQSASFEVRLRAKGVEKYRLETTAEKTLTLEGLEAATQYEWAVRGVCGQTNQSVWIEGAPFTTQIAPCENPVGLNAEVVLNEKKVVLNWYGEAQDYVVRYKLQAATSYLYVAVKSHTYTIAKIGNGVYNWGVQSACSADSSLYTEGTPFEVKYVDNENLQEAGIQVYSHNGRIQIKSVNGLVLDQVEVLDTRGQIVCRKSVRATETEMDCHFANGTYVLRICVGDKIYTSKLGLLKN